MKKLVRMLIFGLLIGVTAGCATKTETIYVKPNCTVPPLPADLPEPNVNYIYDNLGADVAEQLLKRERLIVDSLMEHRARLKALCGEGSGDGDH